MFVVLDTSRWDRVPCFTPALGREDAVAAFNAATAEIGRLLRWFERAERVDRGDGEVVCLRWRACLGVLALAPGLLRGSDAARAARDR